MRLVTVFYYDKSTHTIHSQHRQHSSQRRRLIAQLARQKVLNGRGVMPLLEPILEWLRVNENQASKMRKLLIAMNEEKYSAYHYTISTRVSAVRVV